MNGLYLNSINELCEKTFTVENITMMRYKVTPPATFKCNKGHLNKSRFFYVIRGGMVFNEGKNNCVRANAGEILYLPSDVEYESKWLMGMEGEYLSFQYNTFALSGEEILLGRDVFVICKDKTGRYLELLLKAYAAFIENSNSSKLRILSLFYAFISDMMDESEKKKAKSNEAIAPIYKGVVYMDKHYSSKIAVKDVAALCNMSESTFRRKFFAYFGMSPHAYIDNLRIQKAKELLSSGTYTVNEVAGFLEFYDTSHFNKFFKKYCGVAPCKYISD